MDSPVHQPPEQTHPPLARAHTAVRFLSRSLPHARARTAAGSRSRARTRAGTARLQRVATRGWILRTGPAGYGPCGTGPANNGPRRGGWAKRLSARPSHIAAAARRARWARQRGGLSATARLAGLGSGLTRRGRGPSATARATPPPTPPPAQNQPNLLPPLRAGGLSPQSCSCQGPRPVARGGGGHLGKQHDDGSRALVPEEHPPQEQRQLSEAPRPARVRRPPWAEGSQGAVITRGNGARAGQRATCGKRRRPCWP